MEPPADTKTNNMATTFNFSIWCNVIKQKKDLIEFIKQKQYNEKCKGNSSER